MKHSPSTFLKRKSLISLRRKDIDGHSIQGFLIGLSDDLLAIEYVYDFQIDGLLVLRRSDITEIKQSATDVFQERLMREEGIRPDEQDLPELLLTGWRSLIGQIGKLFPIMILERELGPQPEFSIGQALNVTNAQVEFQSFNGVGKWYAKNERLKYSQITSLQVNTRYLNSYQKYFDRKG